MSCFRLFAALILSSLLFPAISCAYVLLPEQILEQTVRALGSAKGLMVDEIILFPATPEGAEPHAFTGVVRYRFPEMFHEEVFGNGNRDVFVVSPKGAAKVSGQELVAETEDRFDHYKDILLYRSPDLLLGRLELAGVNTGRVSLGRFEGRIHYVIGAQYPDETVPQVWIDKETFLPSRWIITRRVPGTNKQGLEVRYEAWKPLKQSKRKKASHYYPMRIVFLQDGQAVSERSAQECTLNPPALHPDFFNVGKITAATEPSEMLLEQRAVDIPLDEVGQTIRDFQKLFED